MANQRTRVRPRPRCGRHTDFDWFTAFIALTAVLSFTGVVSTASLEPCAPVSIRSNYTIDIQGQSVIFCLTKATGFIVQHAPGETAFLAINLHSLVLSKKTPCVAGIASALTDT